MNKGAWTRVYPDKVERVKKYFSQELRGAIFIRLYEVGGNHPYRLQISGDDIGFASKAYAFEELDDIVNDFPFIQIYRKEV